MGRPARTLTADQIGEVETLAAVLSAGQMADYFGVGRTTFYAMMQREPGIAERYKRGRARAIGAIAQSLITKARSGDTACMIFYLKTQAGWRETAPPEEPDTVAQSGSGATDSLKRFLDEIAARTGRIGANGRPPLPAPA